MKLGIAAVLLLLSACTTYEAHEHTFMRDSNSDYGTAILLQYRPYTPGPFCIMCSTGSYMHNGTYYSAKDEDVVYAILWKEYHPSYYSTRVVPDYMSREEGQDFIEDDGVVHYSSKLVTFETRNSALYLTHVNGKELDIPREKQAIYALQSDLSVKEIPLTDQERRTLIPYLRNSYGCQYEEYYSSSGNPKLAGAINRLGRDGTISKAELCKAYPVSDLEMGEDFCFDSCMAWSPSQLWQELSNSELRKESVEPHLIMFDETTDRR